MANSDAKQIVKKNSQHIRLSDVCNWVKSLWKNILPEIIIQSFKTCSITNSLNEDDVFKTLVKRIKKNLK